MANFRRKTLDLNLADPFQNLLYFKIQQKDSPKEKNVKYFDEMLLKYYRFKIFWKQEELKKFLESYLGIKYSQIVDQGTGKKKQGTPFILLTKDQLVLPKISKMNTSKKVKAKKKRRSVMATKSTF